MAEHTFQFVTHFKQDELIQYLHFVVRDVPEDIEWDNVRLVMARRGYIQGRERLPVGRDMFSQRAEMSDPIHVDREEEEHILTWDELVEKPVAP